MKVEGLLGFTLAAPGVVVPAVSALNAVTSAALSVAGVPVATMLIEPVVLAVPETAKV